MTEQFIKSPIPKAPHPDTLANPHMTIASQERGQLICYCPQHRCGAVLHIQAQLWAIYCPLTLQEFCDTLGKRGIMLPQGQDLDTWLQAVTLSSLVSGHAH